LQYYVFKLAQFQASGCDSGTFTVAHQLIADLRVGTTVSGAILVDCPPKHRRGHSLIQKFITLGVSVPVARTQPNRNLTLRFRTRKRTEGQRISSPTLFNTAEFRPLTIQVMGEQSPFYRAALDAFTRDFG
jgi:hypothetical protein